MKKTVLVMVVVLVAFGTSVVGAQDIKKPEPTVPEIFTLTGEFVRVAYNNEGYVTLGYRVANDSVAEDWMLLEIGATLRGKTKGQTMKLMPTTGNMAKAIDNKVQKAAKGMPASQ